MGAWLLWLPKLSGKPLPPRAQRGVSKLPGYSYPVRTLNCSWGPGGKKESFKRINRKTLLSRAKKPRTTRTAAEDRSSPSLPVGSVPPLHPRGVCAAPPPPVGSVLPLHPRGVCSAPPPRGVCSAPPGLTFLFACLAFHVKTKKACPQGGSHPGTFWVKSLGTLQSKLTKYRHSSLDAHRLGNT